jgi:hypothetical protein
MLPLRLPSRPLSASFSALALWLAAMPALAQVPDCVAVVARAAPSSDGVYDHSLTIINNCDVRMKVKARYADAPASTAKGESLAKGDTATITLGASQPTEGFNAHYDVTYDSRWEAASPDKPATAASRATARSKAASDKPATAASRATARSKAASDKPATAASRATARSKAASAQRSTAPRKEPAARSPDSSAPRGSSLSSVELCDRAMRKIFKLEGLSEKDPKLNDRIENCPSRMNTEPQKRRAEMECVLGAHKREDLRTCFGTK